MIVYKVFKETLTNTCPVTWSNREFLPFGTFYGLKEALEYKKLAENQEKANNVFYDILVKEL